jgi:uncharacterized protein YkwD
MKGYDDGTVRPENLISFAEAAAIITRAFWYHTEKDVHVWYKPHVDALASRNAIPMDIRAFDAPIDRGMLAEIVYRLITPVTDQPSLTYDLIASGAAAHAAADDDIRAEMLRLVNETRASFGLHPYRHNDRLQDAAQLHSEDMQRLQYLSHDSKDGRKAEDRIRASGYLSVDLKTCGCKSWSYRWGEVIADRGKTPKAVIDAFMGSPVHRSILVSTEFDEAGVGNVGEYWVIDTGRIIFK